MKLSTTFDDDFPQGGGGGEEEGGGGYEGGGGRVDFSVARLEGALQTLFQSRDPLKLLFGPLCVCVCVCVCMCLCVCLYVCVYLCVCVCVCVQLCVVVFSCRRCAVAGGQKKATILFPPRPSESKHKGPGLCAFSLCAFSPSEQNPNKGETGS